MSDDNKEQQLEMSEVMQVQELRRPDRAIIKCSHRDNHVEEFVQWYGSMKLKYTVVIDPKYSQKIEIDLVLGDEVLDQLECPYEQTK